MKRSTLYLLVVLFILYGCSNKFTLYKKYVYKNDSKRVLSLNFVSDSFCVIRNSYADGEEKEQIDYKCRYFVLSKDYLLLVNSGEMIDTAGKGFFFFPFNNPDTLFVKQSHNSDSVFPNYSHGNYKYLKVPYVEYDTLIRYKRTIAWIKKDRSNKVVGYYKFKPD